MKQITLTIPDNNDYEEILEVLQNALNDAGFNADIEKRRIIKK
jgi:hypothetical protein